MLFVEDAAVCLIAIAASVETEIVAFGLQIYRALDTECNCRAEFHKHFFKANSTTQKLQTKPAKELYRVAEDLVRCYGVQPAWPDDSYGKIAEPRNKVVHRTCSLRDGQGPDIMLLEDFDPHVLRDCVVRSALCMDQCFKTFDALIQQKAKFSDCDIARDVVASPRRRSSDRKLRR